MVDEGDSKADDLADLVSFGPQSEIDGWVSHFEGREYRVGWNVFQGEISPDSNTVELKVL